MVLRRRLQQLGLSGAAIDAAWPTWWSESADGSTSAAADLRFSLARKLGLDPRSLLAEDEAPRFLWKDEARFKNLKAEDEEQISALSSFGRALSNLLTGAMEGGPPSSFPTALELRQALLEKRPYIGLINLLSTAWAMNIPVVHLRIYPLPSKRMAAMTSRGVHGSSILLAKDSNMPATVAFYVAHELGHIFLGHVNSGESIIDMDADGLSADDDEEIAADRFALQLLTGEETPSILPGVNRYRADQLARAAVEASVNVHIEPGTLALCLGFATGDWKKVNAAMKLIYKESKPVWAEVNGVARRQLRLSTMGEDMLTYVESVLGYDANG